jgi:hypothetical protein
LEIKAVRNPEDIVRRMCYDPTGTDPEPPFVNEQPQRQWKRTVCWVLAATGFVALTLLVSGRLL